MRFSLGRAQSGDSRFTDINFKPNYVFQSTSAFYRQYTTCKRRVYPEICTPEISEQKMNVHCLWYQNYAPRSFTPFKISVCLVSIGQGIY